MQIVSVERKKTNKKIKIKRRFLMYDIETRVILDKYYLINDCKNKNRISSVIRAQQIRR
jgi:hypothetical protein